MSWTEVLRAVNPRFEFTNQPFRHSLPMSLAFATTGDQAAAVLTSPTVSAGTSPGPNQPQQPPRVGDMARVSLEGQPLPATATLVWSGDLPRPLQQILFDTANGVAAAAEGPEASAAPVLISA